MSGERIIPEGITTIGEYIIYLKEKFLYTWAKKFISQGSRCLDLGCGDGYGTKILSGENREVIGIDIDCKIIQRADSKYGSENCRFQVYDGKKLPYSDKSIDFVSCFHVLEHVRDDLAFLKEIFRILKPGGILILATPNKVLRLPHNHTPWNIYHIREYTPEELVDVLQKVFEEFSILGVKAIDDIMNLEIKRFRTNLKIASLDFLNLRRMIPPGIMDKIVKFLHLLIRDTSKRQDFRCYFKQGELFQIISDVENCLDIIAICRK